MKYEISKVIIGFFINMKNLVNFFGNEIYGVIIDKIINIIGSKIIKNEILWFGKLVEIVVIWISFGLFLGIIFLCIYFVNIGFVIMVVGNVIINEYKSIFFKFVL